MRIMVYSLSWATQDFFIINSIKIRKGCDLGNLGSRVMFWRIRPLGIMEFGI